MTVSSTLRKVVLNGNGVATAFPFSYKVFSKTDLRGIVTNSAGLETELVLDSDFSVVLNADQDNSPGGTVTYPISGSPLVTGSSLTILSNVPYLQSTDITNAGGFYPQVIEDALDRNVIQIQQNKELLDRALTIPVAVSGVSTDLPEPEPDSVIAWNDDGTALQNISLTTLATVVAFGTAQGDIFTGNGVATVFVLTANPGSLYNLDVSIGGVSQLPGIDYTWSGGTTLTTTSPVPNGVKMLVRYMQGMPSGITAANAVTYADTDVGASLQSRLNRIVDSIAALKTVDKTKYTRAFVTGYYAPGDGGGGGYWYDSSDTTSADNGGSIIVAADGGRWKLQFNNGLYNVKQFGAKGDGATSDVTAINNAYAAIPAGGGCLYFPASSGAYLVASALSFTSSKPFTIKGDGALASSLSVNFTSGDAITVNGASAFGISDISVLSSSNRVASTYLIRVKNCIYPSAQNVRAFTGTGGLWMFESCNFLQMSGCQGDSNNGTSGNTCLRIKSCGGTVTNCYFRVGPFSAIGYANCSPCLYITGTTTSLQISNSGFAGGGARSTWTVTGITSTAGNFTVTTSAPHDFQTGDFIVLRGNTPAAYNSVFRITSVTATTVVVTSTLNPGASSVNGTAESLAACGYVSNEDGPVNESRISNVLFEAGQGNSYGSIGLYFDARRGTAGARGAISGWNIDNCYFDFGATGLCLSGTAANAGNDPSLQGFTIANCICSSLTRAMWFDQVAGVNLSNSQLCTNNGTLIVEQVTYGINAGLYIYGGAAAPFTQGLTITGCNIGMPRGWNATYSTLVFGYGVMVDQPANILDTVISDCNIFGSSFSINDILGAEGNSRLRVQNCNLNYGAWPPANTNFIPSVASAAAISIYPYNEVQKITGTTNISTIGPATIGKEYRLIFTSALSLITGGNLAITATYNVLAGQMVTFINDGTSWYLK